MVKTSIHPQLGLIPGTIFFCWFSPTLYSSQLYYSFKKEKENSGWWRAYSWLKTYRYISTGSHYYAGNTSYIPWKITLTKCGMALMHMINTLRPQMKWFCIDNHSGELSKWLSNASSCIHLDHTLFPWHTGVPPMVLSKSSALSCSAVDSPN